MGRIIIYEETTKKPITLIGKMAGVCYGANTEDDERNYKRGLDCLHSQHGRTWELPDIYVCFDEYSARTDRELYTHIGGSPTRLQSSTRYINYKNFDYYTPESIANNEHANKIYSNLMTNLMNGLVELEQCDIHREDSANVLPLGMNSKVVAKYNLRTVIDMSHQRECTRAYHEFRDMFKDLKQALSAYSEEWKYIVDNFFMPKCEFMMYCPEKFSCGKYPNKEVVQALIKEWREKQKNDGNC